jgi:RNA polymerase-interacting CarD/CdnL/TRCF family regulator
MTSTLRLSLGDLVVRHGKVLKVSQINQNTVGLQPFFDFQGNHGLTFTLELKNAYDGHIRRLVSKSKIKTLLKLIIKKSTSKTNPPVFDAKTALSHNQLEETLWVIKTLWLEKQEKSDTLPSGKSTIFRKAMLQATEEIAATNHTSPEQAKSLILSGLKSNLKNH